MESKIVIGLMASALIGLLTWNLKTTFDLVMQVQRLEIILLDDALLK